MKTTYSHFYLYAKRHYLKSADVIADLSKIVAHRSGCDAKYISKRDVYEVLVNAVVEHVFGTASCTEEAQRRVETLLRDIAKLHFFQSKRDADVAVIEECLSYLCCTQIKASDGSWLVELEPATPDVLPLAQPNSKMVVVYEAVDGKRFDTKDEVLQWEASLEALRKANELFNDGNSLWDALSVMNEALNPKYEVFKDVTLDTKFQIPHVVFEKPVEVAITEILANHTVSVYSGCEFCGHLSLYELLTHLTTKPTRA